MKIPAFVFTLTLVSLAALPAKDTHHRTVKLATKSQDKSASSSPSSSASVFGPAPFSTVVVDAGHGGHDPGGIPENLLPEKDVALDIARRLSYAVEDAGLRSLLTRRDDTFITLQDRVNVSNAQEGAIFVSIHFNAAPRREARGIETYYSKSAEGAALAARIQHNMMSTTTGEDRGIKAADFYVLRKNKDLCVLVECGFLTNPEDVALALSDDYRQKVAEKICAAIVDYRNSLAGKTDATHIAALSSKFRMN
jgi:N-acetylmuramoyl-L-alanine amidase